MLAQKSAATGSAVSAKGAFNVVWYIPCLVHSVLDGRQSGTMGVPGRRTGRHKTGVSAAASVRCCLAPPAAAAAVSSTSSQTLVSPRSASSDPPGSIHGDR